MKPVSLSSPRLIKTKLKDGVWHGILRAPETPDPQIQVTHLNTPVPDVALIWDTDQGHWHVTIPIPTGAITDGVQVLLVRDVASERQIGDITLLAGEPLAADIRAEVATLRAELDLLQRAFRRHCQEER